MLNAQTFGPGRTVMTDRRTDAVIESARLVTVAMLTYRRLDQLPDVIPAVLAQLDELVAAGGLADRAELLVVDNDPAASARSVVETVGQGRPEVRYVCEPEPGIAAGRNRALDETETSDAVVFIDDDERPGTGWLVHLVRTWRDSGAGAVSGPVRSTSSNRSTPGSKPRGSMPAITGPA